MYHSIVAIAKVFEPFSLTTFIQTDEKVTYRSTFCLATFPAISYCDLAVFEQPRPPPCPPCPPTAAARTTVSSSEAPATQVNRICRIFLFCCGICRSVFCCRNSGSCRICRIIVSLKGFLFCHSVPSEFSLIINIIFFVQNWLICPSKAQFSHN